jgi:hypothetical protein
MKLHLLLLASLFNLSTGFMAELKGPLTDEKCEGDEYADFRRCAMLGAVGVGVTALQESALNEEAFMNQGGERQLVNPCTGCPDGAQRRGSFCFTFCGSGRRLLSEEGSMDTPNLRRLAQPDLVGGVDKGAYFGNGRAKKIAEVTIECLGKVSTNHPCLGSTETMVLTVTL